MLFDTENVRLKFRNHEKYSFLNVNCLDLPLQIITKENDKL